MIEIGEIGSTPIEKVLNINDVNDNVVIKYAIGEKDSLTKMLMQEHNVSISFRYPTFISFKKGYYLTFNGIKYWLMNDYKAVESNGEYRYDLVFHAKEMLFQDVQYWYDKNNVDQSEYGLTGNASYFLQLAVENINKHYGANFVNQGTVEQTDIKYIQFANNTNVFDALSQVCDTFDCEWMLVGDTINIIEKANFGDAIDFIVGETVLKIDRREGEDKFDANRILALGSTLNLTESYQGGDYMIGSKRLRIPTSKGKYIDLKPNLKPTEVKTATVIFDDIFPKRVGNIEEVREIEYKVDENGNEVITKQYRFKDNGIVFSDDYLLPNEPLMLVFETGKLAGLHFELYFSKDGYSETDNSQYYEILVNNTYGSQLPNETLKPEIGDKYVLYNFNIELVSHVYIPKAENELFEFATKWLKNEWVDKGVYECPIMGRYSRDNDVDLEIGQIVDLYSPTFDSGKRESRVMGYVKPLMSKFDAVYTIGDNKAYSPKSNIQQRITKLEATEYAINGVSGSGGDVYIIKQFDSSLPTDFNVYSAKASNAKYFNKQTGDTVQGDALFQKNVQVQGNAITDVIQNSTFQSGEFGTGYQIKNDIGSGKSYMEVDNLRVRDEMIVSQLTIDEIRSVGGSIMLSLADLKAIEVQELANTYRVLYDNQNGELVNKFTVGDQALCQTFNGGEIKRYWRLVTAVGDNYIELSKTDAEIGSKAPTKDDVIVQFGHRTNVNRQYAQLISSYPPFGIRQYNGVDSFSTQGKEITRIGDPINGNYFEAAQFVIKSHGITSPIYRDRGLFANGTQYYKNDRVSWLGSLWVCLEDTKTIPSETATFWRKETSGQTDINNSINNISIGGINFLLNTSKVFPTIGQDRINQIFSKYNIVNSNFLNAGLIGEDIVLSFKYSVNSVSKQFSIRPQTMYTYIPIGSHLYINDSNKEGIHVVKISSIGSNYNLSTGVEFRADGMPTDTTIIISNVQLEIGNKATSWSPSPQDYLSGIDNAQNTANNAQSLANSSKNYIDNVLQSELEDIRDQIDGKVNSYFYDYDPTVNNIPASEWTTEEDKESHLNDTFTNTYSGMSWRWLKVNGVYDWVVISDTASTEALAKAAEALQIANNKMQVFVNTPYTPYQVGDLWVQGANGDILRCNNSRQSGDFDANDWGRASNYTDDTVANEANDKADDALNEITVVRSEFNAELSVQNDKINSKVSQTDFDELDNEVTITKSEVQQLSGSLTSTIEKVDNISIGGINFLLNTIKTFPTLGQDRSNQIFSRYNIVNGNFLNAGLIGEDIVLSYKYKVDSASKQFTIRMQTISTFLPLGTALYISDSNKEGTHVVKLSSIGANYNLSSGVEFRADGMPTDTTITISNVQLEIGNKATSWSPSPQDYINGIDNAQNTANSKTRTYRQDTTPTVPSGGHTVGDTWYYISLVDFDGNINTDASKNEYELVRRWDGNTWVRIKWNAARTKVVQTDDQIRQTVEKTGIDQLGQGENLYSVFDQRADSITIEVSNVSNKADAAQNTANNANNAASDAQDKADKAEQDALNAQTKANEASESATEAKNTATSAQNSANTANSLLTDLSSDGKLTPNEKIDTKRELDIIKSEYPKNTAQADKFSVSKTTYTNAYNALNTYLTPLLANMNQTSNIVSSDFTARFKAYYDAQTDLLNNVSIKAKDIADSKTTPIEVNNQIKSTVKITSNSVEVDTQKMIVNANLIANAIETESLDVGGGNFQVTKEGILSAKGANIQGKIESNDSGNRIVIDPTTREFSIISSNGQIVGGFKFDEISGSSFSVMNTAFVDSGNNPLANTDISPFGVTMYDNIGDSKYANMTPSALEIGTNGVSANFKVSISMGRLVVRMKELPNSSLNVQSGELYTTSMNGHKVICQK